MQQSVACRAFQLHQFFPLVDVTLQVTFGFPIVPHVCKWNDCFQNLQIFIGQLSVQFFR